jgi:phosphonoacetaldehyde hydrolase
VGEWRIRAVVLDWAGTTQDHGSVAPVAAFVEAFRRFGVEISVAEARGPMGLFKLDHIKTLLANPSIARRWQHSHGRACEDRDVLEIYEALRTIQAEVLPRYERLIAGTVEAVRDMRSRGYRVASTTGYPASIGARTAESAAAQGYAPDVIVCADEVPAGRPEPWMLLRALEMMRVYPPSSVVKVGDTRADIGEGINAGAWAVGISRTGNYVGLTEDELEALPADERGARIEAAAAELRACGAHYVVESIADLEPALDDIERRLARGERP